MGKKNKNGGVYMEKLGYKELFEYDPMELSWRWKWMWKVSTPNQTKIVSYVDVKHFDLGSIIEEK